MVSNPASETAERIGGIYALGEFFDLGKDDPKMTRVASIYRVVLKGTDLTAMVPAAQGMGKLCAPGHAMTAELVEAEVQAALESLQIERNENRRYAAVLTLRALADNAPTLVYQFVPNILEVIWVAVRDIRLFVRECAAEAIAALIEIIAARDSMQRDKWFTKIYIEIKRGFALNTLETVHGSLLTLKEMFLKGGMFMQSGLPNRYVEACDKIFLYREHKHPDIRREVTAIIPIAAGYYPAEFSSIYLHKSMNYLQGQLKRGDRDPAFVAIGKVASAVGSPIDAYLDTILVYVREGLSVKA
jgi:FKBP12-rapamycin complex-associated protein